MTDEPQSPEHTCPNCGTTTSMPFHTCLRNPERTKRYNPDDHDGLVMLSYRIEKKRYSQVRAIFAELGQSDTLLKRALKEGHGIEFDFRRDPWLFFVISQQQTDGLAKAGITAPTFLQLLGTCEVVSLSQEEAEKRFKALKEC